MKYYLFTTLIVFAAFIVSGQEYQKETGSFGKNISKEGAVSAKLLPQKIGSDGTIDIKLQGTINEVCQAKGCWMTIDLGDGKQLRVKFKDYGFFVPKNSAGKTAIMQGVAQKETISVDELKHLAKDAGKSEDEINAINEPQEELTFIAEGVIIQ